MSTRIEIVRRCAVFAGFPDPERERIAERAVIRHFEAGVRIADDQSPQESLCVVDAGFVSIAALGKDGKEGVLTLLGPGAWFGNAVFSPGLPRVLNVDAHTEVSLLDVPGRFLRERLDLHPRAAIAVLDSLARRFWALLTIFQDQAVHPVPVRVVRRLFLLHEIGAPDDETDTLSFDLTQEMLAHLMGMSRQGLRPALKELEAANLLTFRYGKIGAPSRAALRRFLEERGAALPAGRTHLT